MVREGWDVVPVVQAQINSLRRFHLPRLPLHPLGHAATDPTHCTATDASGKPIPLYGELLVGFQLIKNASRAKLPLPKSIVPVTEDWFIEIVALGCRSLAPFEMLPIYLPHVEFDLGSSSRSAEVRCLCGNRHRGAVITWGESQVIRTKQSKSPSGVNPNFVEVRTQRFSDAFLL